MKSVTLYTDGACSGNPGPGGWGALLRHGDNEKQLSGAEHDTTNNRMELMAVIQGLKSLTQPCKVRVVTDSKYVMDGWNNWLPNWQKNNWKTAARKSVKNQDLWQQLLQFGQGHQLEWEWVKGHSGHIENELVDQLARSAITDLESID